MGPVDAAYLEVIKQLDGPAPERMLLVRLANTLQQLDLVQCSLGVVSRAFHNFQGYKALLPAKET